MSPAVSVVLPFRHAQATLHQAIESIATQSHREWELLLVANDAGQEETRIASEWCRLDPRIRLVREDRPGIAYALVRGLSEATAHYIARMDADDISHPRRLEEQVAYMERFPDIGVLGTRTTFRSTVTRSEGMRAFVDWQNALLTPEQHYLKRFVDAPLAHPTVMFRRELVERCGGYATGPLPEDHELWLRWMHQGVRFAKLPGELLTWNDHPQRLSRTHANYSTEAFITTKARWIAAWYRRTFPEGHPVIIAGTSPLCRSRAELLAAEGLPIRAFTDVRERPLPGHRFIPHTDLPGPGEALIISLISQRGTGERIAAFLNGRGLREGRDHLLAA